MWDEEKPCFHSVAQALAALYAFQAPELPEEEGEPEPPHPQPHLHPSSLAGTEDQFCPSRPPDTSEAGLCGRPDALSWKQMGMEHECEGALDCPVPDGQEAGMERSEPQGKRVVAREGEGGRDGEARDADTGAEGGHQDRAGGLLLPLAGKAGAVEGGRLGGERQPGGGNAAKASGCCGVETAVQHNSSESSDHPRAGDGGTGRSCCGGPGDREPVEHRPGVDNPTEQQTAGTDTGGNAPAPDSGALPGVPRESEIASEGALVPFEEQELAEADTGVMRCEQEEDEDPAWSKWEWTAQHVLLPALRFFLKPPSRMLKDGSFIKVSEPSSHGRCVFAQLT